MAELKTPRPLPLLLAAAAVFAFATGLAIGSQSFLRPDSCAPSALASAAVNFSGAVGSLLACALRCTRTDWCAAMLVGRSRDCELIDSMLFYESWIGQGADCPDGLYEKDQGNEWLTFSSCEQKDVTHNASCGRAMDRNTNRVFYDGSCTHTNTSAHNWWRASLPQRAYIDHVVLYNRLQSSAAYRLNNFTISLDGAVFAS
ncbi:hypothetical protein BOX15_Mlig027575g1 [Macrostomum lignano]|uniref:FTP domain-containing protein n=2 Tax=Macrostomum lignano TaxID=282301 RepID=A0A1I8FY74_9PLAT|nr:hypothetical protein BOX15_Mlig027575g1 [Macrostomum lignano]